MAVDKRFDYRNWLGKFADTNNTGLRTITDDVVRRILVLLGDEPADTDPPAAPTSLTASGGVESVGLRWTAPSDLDVVRYRVQQSTTSGSGFSTIAETPHVSHQVLGLTGGTTYYFQVAAIDDAGNVGPYSNESSSTPATSGGSGTPPGAPSGLVGEAGDTIVDLDWVQSDPTGIYHTVYRGTVSGSLSSIVSGLTRPFYQDTGRTNGTEYFYAVTSTNANGDESAESAEISVTPEGAAVNAAPGKVTGLSGTAGYLGVRLNWNILPETDIDYYRIYAGTSSGVYTLTWDIEPGTNLADAGDVHTVFVGGLAASTPYFFTVKGVDTAGNVGAGATEISVTNLGSAPVSPTAPAAPTGLYIASEGNGFVTVGWAPNSESDIVRYVVARNNGTGTAYSAVGTVTHPSTQYVFDQLTNGLSYGFKVQAVNSSNLLSGFSLPVFGTPESSSGGGGGSVVIPPGGGTGVGGLFSGDTGLGPRHKAPGASFDYIIDVSTSIFGGQLWNQIGSAAQLAANTGEIGNGDRVAILLPERVFNINDYTPQGAFAVNPSEGAAGLYFNSNQWQSLECRLAILDSVQWHFIAPWPTASLGDSLATAKAATKKFRLECKTADGNAFFNAANPQANNFGMVMTNYGRPGLRFGFWWMEFACWGAATLTGSVVSNGSGGMKLTLYGCDFTHRNPFPGGTTPGLNENKHPRWTISTWGVLYDYIQYSKFDCPWNSEHIFYERNPPIGDAYITHCDFTNSGASCFQTALRVQGVDGAPDLTGGQEAGHTYFEDCKFENFARSSWGTAAITWYTTHRDLSFIDCVWMTQANGKVNNWPPANPSANPLPEASPLDGSGNPYGQDFIVVGTQPIGAFLPDGHGNVSLTMTGCLGYQRLAQDGMLRINSVRTIDISECGFYANAAAQREPVKLTRNREGCTALTPVNSFTMDNCNKSAHLVDLRALYPSIVPVSDGDLKIAGGVYSHPPDPISNPFGDRTDGNRVLRGAMNTINVSNVILP